MIDIQDFLEKRGKSKTFRHSLTIHKIPFSFFAYLSTLEGVTKVKRQKRIYKILIKDFAHEHFFGANWWKNSLPNMTVEGLDSVIITYNRKKPDCIQLTFKGMKMTGLSGIVAWNTLNPVTDADNEYDPMFDEPLKFY
jgi:hypothetical protein